MDLHCLKWKIGLKIGDFVFLTEILPKFCPNCALFTYLRSPTAHLCLSKYIFGIVLFAQPLFLSIYGFTVFQMENWPQNWRFCILLPKFYPKFALFACLRAPTTQLCLSKYMFGIVLFAQPFFPSIYWFTVFQMENWPQNWRFCIF